MVQEPFLVHRGMWKWGGDMLDVPLVVGWPVLWHSGLLPQACLLCSLLSCQCRRVVPYEGLPWSHSRAYLGSPFSFLTAVLTRVCRPSQENAHRMLHSFHRSHCSLPPTSSDHTLSQQPCRVFLVMGYWEGKAVVKMNSLIRRLEWACHAQLTPTKSFEHDMP